jgi:hypothetical protein
MSFGRFSIESKLILGLAVILGVFLLANKFLNIIAAWLH